MHTNIPSLRQLEIKHQNLEERIAKQEGCAERDQLEVLRLKRLKLITRRTIEQRRLAEAGLRTPEPAA